MPADDRERGAAVVEYVLVSVLLIMVFLAVVQFALVIHTRDVLVADAAEGARTAALRDSGLPAGERACTDLVRHAVGGAVRTPCAGSYEGTTPELVRMRVSADVPLMFVPGGRVHLDVSARAMREPR
ncbi:MAG TPA: TadE family protein [Mycobacteriales bacterium]